MKVISNLNSVHATLLPARVMVLLSKYARAVKEYDGVIIQLSSLNVFKHVHASYIRSKHPAVHLSYRYLLLEVNRQLAEGNMVADNVKVKESSEQPAISIDERFKNLDNWKNSETTSTSKNAQ